MVEYTIECFTMWEEKIIFRDGWFIYFDSKGNVSVISHQCAREMERHYQGYQASMDVEKGGESYDAAFDNRGFSKENDTLVYQDYCVDHLVKGTVRPIASVLIIPKSISGIRINAIADKAFYHETAIEKAVLHEDITMIGNSAFEGCVNLKEAVIPGEHCVIKDNAFKDTALHTDNGVFYLGNTLVRVNPAFCGKLEIKNDVSAIANAALKDCRNIKEVILPEHLISVGDYAFEGCTGIRSINLPESLQSIGNNAFCGCTGLETIAFPRKMNDIGRASFSNCIALKSAHLPDGITNIKLLLFSGCENLTDVRIPDSVIGIERDAFAGCGLMNRFERSDKEELYIDKWLICCKDTGKETLIIREGCVGIAAEINAPKTICAVTLPNSLKTIGRSAFEETQIKEIKLPVGLQYIELSAFRGSKLERIVIPASVKKIAEWAFMHCENLVEIIVEGANTEIVFPAITGRRDKEQISIKAPKNSTAHFYCQKYGEKEKLKYEPEPLPKQWLRYFAFLLSGE